MKNIILIAFGLGALMGCALVSPQADEMDPETDPPPAMEEPNPTPAPNPAPMSCDAGDTLAEHCRTDCGSRDAYWICTGGNDEADYSWECICDPEEVEPDPEPRYSCDPGTVRPGDCAEECGEGSSYRVCIDTGDDFAWTCVVHDPVRCRGEEPEPTPEQDRTVTDDPDARIIVTVAGLEGPVRIEELVPVPTGYTPTGADGILETNIRPRFRESDGRLRFQVWQNDRPLTGISAGECVTLVESWQLGTHDLETGDGVECYPEFVDGVCAFTIPRYYDTWYWYSHERFLETARYELDHEDPPPSCVPTTEICGDGIDQDCDGSDLSCPSTSACGSDPLIGSACHDGLGECRRDGHLVCDESTGGLVCSVSALPAGTETCNGLDDDCDGLTDEDSVCAPSTRRLRVEMRVTATSPSGWGAAHDHQIAADAPLVGMTCVNTGSTSMQSIGGGWYRCEIDVPTGEFQFVGRFRSPEPAHGSSSYWLGSTTDWGASSCYGTDGVTIRVYDASGSSLAPWLGYGDGGCRHFVL